VERWFVQRLDVKPCEMAKKFPKQKVFCTYYIVPCWQIETCPYKRKKIKEMEEK
jgi:hypothetical protein